MIIIVYDDKENNKRKRIHNFSIKKKHSIFISLQCREIHFHHHVPANSFSIENGVKQEEAIK